MQVCCCTSLLPRSSATPLPASPRDAASPGGSATTPRPHMPLAARHPDPDILHMRLSHASTMQKCTPPTTARRCTRTHTPCANGVTHEHAMRPAPSRSARGVRDSTRVHATKSRQARRPRSRIRGHGHKSLCYVASRVVLAPPRDTALPAPANDAAGTRAGGIPRQRVRRAADTAFHAEAPRQLLDTARTHHARHARSMSTRPSQPTRGARATRAAARASMPRRPRQMRSRSRHNSHEVANQFHVLVVT
jgi:hypothetical protein